LGSYLATKEERSTHIIVYSSILQFNFSATCAKETNIYSVSDFSIGHRGAAMQFPEHTLESYAAASIQGAGIIECDVTFTKDRELVCRHSQCDLHTTTNIVSIPEMNAKCSTPWAPGVAPNCCTSDFTLAEIKTLCAKMDSSGGIGALTAEEYSFGGTADWRTDLYQYACSEVPTHKESIAFIGGNGGYFTPELKTPSVEMPYEGDYTQEDFAQQMIADYIDAGVAPAKVWPQSFLPADVFYWVENTDYGAQAVALDGDYESTEEQIDIFLDLLVANNVKIVAPPMQRLVEPAPESAYLMQPSYYAKAAKERGIGIITWTLERAGPGLAGWYFSTTENAGLDLNEGDRYNLLYVLAKEVEILGIFSDWPATVTFFANCMDLGLREPRVVVETDDGSVGVELGPRPFYLVEQMRPSTLKDDLGEYRFLCFRKY
jgi:glycerophosphoryl diester phosphodiesterase